VDSGADVYLNGKCRTDFGDIRFTDDDGTTLLDYWIEEKVDSDYAVFWVEVADDLSTTAATIYIYYGNAGATTTSNGENTFILFDDFEDGSFNTSKWSAVSCNVSEGSGVLHCQASASHGGVRSVNSIDLTSGKAFEIRHKHSMYTDNDDWFGFSKVTTAIYVYGNNLVMDRQHTNQCEALLWNGAWYYISPFNGPPDSNFYRANVRAKIGSYPKYMMRGIEGILSYNVASDTYYLWIYKLAIETPDTNRYAEIDWIAVRKWVDPEPAHGSWGSEETAVVAIERFQEEGVDFRETKFGATWA
jgi:hypothetical protein